MQALCSLPWSADADVVHALLADKARRAPLGAVPGLSLFLIGINLLLLTNDANLDYYAVAFAFAVCRGDYRRGSCSFQNIKTLATNHVSRNIQVLPHNTSLRRDCVANSRAHSHNAWRPTMRRCTRFVCCRRPIAGWHELPLPMLAA
jgi:hypothetical protein